MCCRYNLYANAFLKKIGISIRIETFKRRFTRFGIYNSFTVKCTRVQKLIDNGRGLTRCGALRTRYTPAIWLISGNVRLNEWTGGARCGSGTLAEYSNGSVSSTYCTRHARDIMTSVKALKTASVSERQIANRQLLLHARDDANAHDRFQADGLRHNFLFPNETRKFKIQRRF